MDSKAIFVSDAEHVWRLGGFEWAGPFEKMTAFHVADVLAFVKLVEECATILSQATQGLNFAQLVAHTKTVTLIAFASAAAS